jgi:uncharacterized protein YlaI
MKLVSVETHDRLKNMDVRNYVCDRCGETETFLVMR